MYSTQWNELGWKSLPPGAEIYNFISCVSHGLAINGFTVKGTSRRQAGRVEAKQLGSALRLACKSTAPLGLRRAFMGCISFFR